MCGLSDRKSIFVVQDIFPISKQFINIYINANSDNFCETKSVSLEIQQNSWNCHLQNEANKEQLR